MEDYHVKHLDSHQAFSRPWMLLNPHHTTQGWSREQVDPGVEAFHRTLPDYNETRLHELPTVAKELGLARVFIKDESTRFGLPAFKVLGASYAIHRTVCKQLGVPASTTLQQLKDNILKNQDESIRLVTCSEGNWGRACGRMAKIYGLPVTIYVPGFMSEYTQNLLRGEGAEVKVLEGGSYDDSIAATRRDSEETGALMVMDVSWDGYAEIPKVS